MKGIILIAFLFGILILPSLATASPLISEITLKPSSEIWIDENLEIKVNCTNGSKVNATLIGETGYIIYVENFNLTNGLYEAKIDSTYWRNKSESFRTIVNCLDESDNTNTQNETNITVSKFNVEIYRINPSTIYLGDMIEVDVLVKKDAVPINSSNINFMITVDDQIKQPEIRPPYDPYDGWIIFLNSSEISNPIKTHGLKIIVSYDRANSTKITSFTINEPIQFSILNVDKTWIKPNDTINLKIQALDRGNIIPLNKENLLIKIDNTQASVVAISPSNDFFSVTILAPNLSPGKYSLIAFLSHKNYTYSSSSIIHYIVPITGKFVDENDKGIYTRISFFLDGIEKLRLYTDATGTYSGSLPPGTYDVEIVFPQSTLHLYEAEINDFEDPIRYYYLDSIDLEGLNVANLFVYEVALPYYKASIDMKYDERNVLDENLLKVYKCEDWNFGRKECHGKWDEIPASVDKVRNMVYVSTKSLSSYAIGTLKKLSVDFNFNKQTFYIKDLVRIRGIVVDEYKNSVDNASVSIQIKNTSINQKVFSDKNGLFTIEFLSPEKEGNYSLTLTAKKHPYVSFNYTLTLQVLKSKEISIVSPDTVRINQGENFTQEFSVVNTGQTELHNLNISLEGIPKEYYILQDNIGKLEINEEKKLKIEFLIPSNASIGTLSCKIKVFNEEVYKEKTFGFTIIEKNQTLESKTTPVGLFGKIVLPQIAPDWIYIFLFAVITFSLSFLLKKRKIKSQGKEEIKHYLLNVKEFLKKKSETATQPMETRPSEIFIEIEEEEEKGIG
ncbi:MAG: carboxypeptidase-like regulatory domain-containing protein [Candidatus Aenigmatarchaeota archaeon]